MISLSVASDGYLCADQLTLSIATGGYISFEEVIVVRRGGSSAPSGYRFKQDIPRQMVQFENIERMRRLEREDEELIFITSQIVLKHGTW